MEKSLQENITKLFAITFVNNYFAEKNVQYYLEGLKALEHRIDSRGDNEEKN